MPVRHGSRWRIRWVDEHGRRKSDRALAPDRFDEATERALSDGNRAGLATALSELEQGSTTALSSLRAPLSKRDDGNYVNFVPLFITVLNDDRPWPESFSRDDLESLAADVAQGAPRAAPMLLARRWFVGHWNIRPAQPPPELVPTSAPPFLILAGEEDAAAPRAEAEVLRDTLGNASHIVTVAGPGHPQLFRGAPCTLDVALAFLRDPTAAPTTMRCE